MTNCLFDIQVESIVEIPTSSYQNRKDKKNSVFFFRKSFLSFMVISQQYASFYACVLLIFYPIF